MQYVIGVDAGGTKTEACAYGQLDKQLLARAQTSFGNVLIDYDLALAHLVEAISDCQSQVPGELSRLCLGIAGIEGSHYRVGLAATLFDKFAVPVTIVNDAKLAHIAYFKGGDGILTIAGTGAVSFAVKGTQEMLSGGWGHLIGDEGSGYWIAMQAIRQMCLAFDENKPLSELDYVILDFFGVKEVPAIKSVVYRATKKELAAVVPSLLDLPEAQGIFQEAGLYLAKMTVNLYNKIGFSEQVSLAIKGSVLLKIPFVQATFLAYLQERIPKLVLITEEISSTKAVCYL